jgi:hypothetical protein
MIRVASDIDIVIRANILAAGGERRPSGTYCYRTVCTQPHAQPCVIKLYANGYFSRSRHCHECYQRALSLLPLRTYLERAQVFAVLRKAPYVEVCLVHPSKFMTSYNKIVSRACCSDCRATHDWETGSMIERYLLVGCLMLPELARAIMWFAVRVQ